MDQDWHKETTISENVSWQTYSVSPYIYCNEVNHNDVPVPKIGPMPAPSGKNALRSHIEKAITLNAQNSENYPYKWGNSTGDFQLTEDEIAIWKKVAVGVNPVFHKPVISKTTLWESTDPLNVPGQSAIVDRISTPNVSILSKVPWDYSWIYQGRTLATTERTYFTPEHSAGVTIYQVTFTDVWEGARDPDPDFYGPNAWVFHEGPSRS